MFASLCWIAWNSAIRWPNACRSFAYPSATSYAACVIPTACAAIPIRPPSSVDIAIRKPWFSSPISRSASTSASTAMSFVTDELSPSFSSVRVTRTWSASRMNAETPRAPAVDCDVRANSRKVPAYAAFVIHCFVPLIRHPPPAVGSALVIGQLVEDAGREAVLAVPLGRVRLDLGGGEVPRERLDLALLGRELEVHRARTIVGCVAHPPGRARARARRLRRHGAFPRRRR